MSDNDFEVIVAEPEQKLKKPPLWQVVFINDDYTPMDFVVEMLKSHFGHNENQAIVIMLDVHKGGRGIAGVYSHDIAETKASIVMHEAREAGHPLATAIHPVDPD